MKRIYKKCSRCYTHFSFECSDIHFMNVGNKEYLSVMCPLCNKKIWLLDKPTDKEIREYESGSAEIPIRVEL